MFVKRRTYQSWFKTKNSCAKYILLIGDPSPPLSTSHMSRIANKCAMVHWESQTVLFRTNWVSHLLHPVHPIPSHCTMGWSGQTGIVPKCPTCPHCLSHPTVLWDAHNIGSKCIFTQSKKSCSYVYLSSQMIMTLLGHVDCSLVGCPLLQSMLLRLHHGFVGCKHKLDIISIELYRCIANNSCTNCNQESHTQCLQGLPTVQLQCTKTKWEGLGVFT